MTHDQPPRCAIGADVLEAQHVVDGEPLRVGEQTAHTAGKKKASNPDVWPRTSLNSQAVLGGGRCDGLPFRARSDPSCALGWVVTEPRSTWAVRTRTVWLRWADRHSQTGRLRDDLSAHCGAARDDGGHVLHRPYDCDSGWPLVDIDDQPQLRPDPSQDHPDSLTLGRDVTVQVRVGGLAPRGRS